MSHYAYFVSSHGLGHAARASAVIAAIHAERPESRFTLFTTAPAWFFADSLGFDVTIEPVDADLGMVQTDALTEDLPATLRELERRVPFRDAEVDALARRVHGADAVVCDIAPLGIAVARRAGLPSVLVENFTWDWIYRGYLDDCPGLAPIADELERVFAQADVRVQTEPVCAPRPDAVRVPPIARTPRRGRDDVRRRLGVPADAPLVMITMGGVDWSYDALAAELSRGDDPWLVIPGSRRRERRGRVIRLPHRSDFYHPDLIHAADAVVGKLGYSTLAEIWSAGVPLAYLTRPRFPESPTLEAWARRELACRRLEPADLGSGAWLDAVRELLASPRRPPALTNGAPDVARAAIANLRPIPERRS